MWQIGKKSSWKVCKKYFENSWENQRNIQQQIRSQVEFEWDICIQHKKADIAIFQPSVKCLISVQFSSSKTQTGFMTKYERGTRLPPQKTKTLQHKSTGRQTRELLYEIVVCVSKLANILQNSAKCSRFWNPLRRKLCI